MADPAQTSGSTAHSRGRGSGRLLIAGLGNPMMADDGIGHEVLRRLDERDLPVHVRLAVIDDDVLSLMHLWEGERTVWLVDAVSSHRPAGTLKVYKHQELFELPAWGVSVHHASLGEGLRWLLHARPEMAKVEFRLFGIEAGVIAPEEFLSLEADQAISTLVDVVEKEARKLPSPCRVPEFLLESTTSS